MASVKDHYDSHLARLYTWTSGGAAGPRARFSELLNAHHLVPSRPGSPALDLGAGSGFQTLPLASAGYAVTAVDLSETLLTELSATATAEQLTVRTILGDLCAVMRDVASSAPELIVCMGDTLTHLDTLTQVEQLLHDAATALAPGGHLLLSFRDYHTSRREGSDRFIPVRSDDNRIFTCFLDYEDTHVAVHDIVHARETTGWKMSLSVYPKLRLDPSRVRTCLQSAGLMLVRDDLQAGLATFVARRPAAR
jgi:SAM-dependent methyltransferase